MNVYTVDKIKEILLKSNPLWCKYISVIGLYHYSNIDDKMYVTNGGLNIQIRIDDCFRETLLSNGIEEGDSIKLEGWLNYGGSRQKTKDDKQIKIDNVNLNNSSLYLVFYPKKIEIISKFCDTVSLSTPKNKGCIKPGCSFLFFLFIVIMSFVGCSTAKTIGNNPNYDLHSLFGRQTSYNQNESFPDKGYKLQAFIYHNIEIHKFKDNDTLYYIKYNPQKEERNYYFTVIDKNTVDTILVNTLDKKKTPSSNQRRLWLYNALNELGIKELTDNKGLWTYFAPKYKIVKGSLPTDIVQTDHHREYETFNYKTAMIHYYEQRHPKHKLTAIEALGALYIINKFSNSKNKNMNYPCRSCGMNFSGPGELHSHENYVHGY